MLREKIPNAGPPPAATAVVHHAAARRLGTGLVPLALQRRALVEASTLRAYAAAVGPGNAAMTRLVAQRSVTAPGHGAPPNAAALRAAAEVGGAGVLPRQEAARLGRGDPVSGTLDLGGARANVYDGPRSHEAAARMGAYAYTWRGDVYLGAGIGEPGGPGREEVLRHEAEHARQSRRPGPPAAESALEADAHAGHGALAADPETPLGLWWLVPLVAGAYVMFRPNVANAPSEEDAAAGRLTPSVPELQVAGEAMALFAVPSAVITELGMAGYGVVSAFAAGGAAGSMAFRGAQDAGAGSFSGAEAYVVDAVTGAVIGMLAGGVFRAFGGSIAPPAPRPQLTHFSTEAGAEGIGTSGVLRGYRGVYALPSTAEQQGMAARALRATIPPGALRAPVRIPAAAAGEFRPPFPAGGLSLYQYLSGVYRTAPGAIDMATGAFTRAGWRILPFLHGNTWPYVGDAAIWGILILKSGSREGAGERGVAGALGLPADFRGMMGNSPPQSPTTDGPFVEIPSEVVSAEQAVGAARAGYDPVRALCEPAEEPTAAEEPPAASDGGLPAVVLVAPTEAAES